MFGTTARKPQARPQFETSSMQTKSLEEKDLKASRATQDNERDCLFEVGRAGCSSSSIGALSFGINFLALAGRRSSALAFSRRASSRLVNFSDTASRNPRRKLNLKANLSYSIPHTRLWRRDSLYERRAIAALSSNKSLVPLKRSPAPSTSRNPQPAAATPSPSLESRIKAVMILLTS